MNSPLLFIVVQDNKVLYYCHNLMELFRLREVYKPTPAAKVYRYQRDKTHPRDIFVRWNADEKVRWWELFNTGLGLEQISYEVLQANYEILKRVWKR